MHRAAVLQHNSNSSIKIVHNSIGHFLRESIWFLFWWCPLLSVDCFHKLFFIYPSENSQAGWDLGNSMARGYGFDAKWVCPMGSYAWDIQVFCSRNEAPPHFLNRTLEYLGITSHGPDSFCVKPITPGHLIPKICGPPCRMQSKGHKWHWRVTNQNPRDSNDYNGRANEHYYYCWYHSIIQT